VLDFILCTCYNVIIEADIVAHGQRVGFLEICYLEQKPMKATVWGDCLSPLSHWGQWNLGPGPTTNTRDEGGEQYG